MKALYQAADEDSATGGPDPLRGIYPVVAVVDEARLPAAVQTPRWPTASSRSSATLARHRGRHRGDQSARHVCERAADRAQPEGDQS